MKGNEALAALWEALGEDHKPPPPNAINAYDYAEKYGVTRASAKWKLDQTAASGKLESGLFNAPGRKSKIRYYWLPEKKGKRAKS